MENNNIEFEDTVLLDEQVYDLAELFKILGDPTRLKILSAIQSKELCVYDIADTLEMTQSAISHQLRILKQARLVRYRRDGKTLFYTVSDEHVAEIISIGLEHTSE